ncbi:TerB family tellurite resistance protein [Streptomyces sp. 549]|uniref:TerB family tellurite resistance protein n=1 Tax=Streptomyces sp. 549 TaxID=3049076 RepID=UPI0024C26EF8|nr:TerB family tellurite resistance protein [Streptomyces sp. 549]MDK1474332.1 TerB family tellurite resistance protein [Streptomyces sp. 549]
MRTAWTTVGDGEFFCPGCGGDRNYERRTGRRRLVVLGLPVLARGSAEPVVACMSCRTAFPATAADQPTTTRLSAMLRDAVHSVALSMLAAGGTDSRAARDTAVGALREAGYPDAREEQLLALLAALGADSVSVEVALHEVLTPLVPHLAPAGRESLLLLGARIALADGPYQVAEQAALASLGTALRLRAAEVERLLAGAPERR